MRLTLVKLSQKIGDLTIKHTNMPERYIRRSLDWVEWKTPNFPNYTKKVIKKRNFRFDVHRPWSREFVEINENKNYRKVFVEPIKEWSIFRGDRVEILVGKDKGKQGIVTEIIQERNWVVVEGMNTYLRLIGKTKKFPGILTQQEAPLLVTNEVSLVDPSDMLPVKVEWRFTEDGEKVRVSERTGRIIPIPTNEGETYDYKAKHLYVEKEKDTKSDDVTHISFAPSLETFEMNIMREMGIKEDREEEPAYWY